MSERLIAHWGTNNAEAFGPSGAKGDVGEDLVVATLHSWGWHAERLFDQRSQMAGIDIRFRNPKWVNWYTADVKANIKGTSFYVETAPDGWLRNPRKISNRIWHVDVRSGLMIWYDRRAMIEYVTNNYSHHTPGTFLSFDDVPFAHKAVSRVTVTTEVKTR